MLENPQFNYHSFYEVMRDFRKGGLNPDIYNEFIQTIGQLPPHRKRTSRDYDIFNKFKLHDVTEHDFKPILREVFKRTKSKHKQCWHPEASPLTCNVDGSGNIIVSAAHSIQNNRTLKSISEDGNVMGYYFESDGFEGKLEHKNIASIFWGFCNKHDAIFYPIETDPYTGTDEQHFLFAYRGFVIASHKKLEGSAIINYGEQSDNDIKENKKIFDNAIIAKDYSIIKTEVIELPAFYPIAASSSFYLDYDFEGNKIPHSEERMEDLFVTLLPIDNKTYLLLSYFASDETLYKNLGVQLKNRQNLKSDISMLLAAHVENIYFNPIYYKTFIQQYEDVLEKILFQSQMDLATFDDDSNFQVTESLTPNNYLNNPYGVNFFGY